MTERERFLGTMRYEAVDRRPLHLVGPWTDTLARWHREGLPPEVTGATLNDYLGVKPLRLRNVSGKMGFHPDFEPRTLREDETVRISIDRFGRTVREFKTHTSMPEWLEFPVKDRASFQRVLDEHYSIENLDERFDADWDRRVREAAESADLIVLDGGCYYWTIRSVAGVAGASYLLYDTPDLVEEMFERYLVVVMEGLRRVTTRLKVDVIGFGEDIAFKSGTLMSPSMFRKLILPRYKKAMDFAHGKAIDLTWYDSDGDLRPFAPDYLSVGINGLAPCEVAAGMAPTELRRRFGRDLRLIGGLDKREVAKGRRAIDAELERNQPVIAEGGYMPAIDHSVSADISFGDYCYFVEALQRALDV